MSDEQFKSKIYKNEVEMDNITGKITRQKELNVSGQDFKEVKKIFDEEWSK